MLHRHALCLTIMKIKLFPALSIVSTSVCESARPDLQPYNPSALVLHSLQTKHILITVAVSAWRDLPLHKFINTTHKVQYKTRYTGLLQ